MPSKVTVGFMFPVRTIVVRGPGGWSFSMGSLPSNRETLRRQVRFMVAKKDPKLLVAELDEIVDDILAQIPETENA